MGDTFKFTDDFQNLILACLVRHPDEFLYIGNILKPAYFNGVIASVTAKECLRYQTIYSRYPTWATLAQLVADEIKTIGDDPETAVDFVRRLKGIDTSDIEYVISRVVEFCRERETILAIKKSIKLVEEGKTPEAGFVQLFEDALKVGQDISDIGYMLHTDYEEVIDKVTDQTFGVRTGFPQYDRIWRRGLSPGWLLVPLAPPKRYKSAFCANIALNMVGPAIAEDVIYYTCEISQEETLIRCLQNISAKTKDYMYDSKEKFKMAVREAMSTHIASRFLIKGFPSKTAQIRDLKAHAKMAINQLGIKPKAIVIDYAETIMCSDKSMSEHQQQASIYTEARAMGAELGCCIIMPDRCNKETVGTPVPSMKSFQGSFQKAGIVDISIGLCATDEEYNSNILRTFVFLNRHGGAFQHFEGKVDPETMQIDIGREIDYNPEEENELPAKKRKDKPKRLAVPDDDDLG